MLGKDIKIKNFILKKNSLLHKKIFKIYKNFIKENNEIKFSLTNKYKDSFLSKKINKFKKINHIALIGMGGSILGAKAIYKFLNPKNKTIDFYDNYSNSNLKNSNKKKITLIISKSGNTLKQFHSNILIKKNINIFLENKKSYLTELAKIKM